MELETLLVRAIAPAHLAEPIIGDLCERRTALTQSLGQKRAQALCRAEALRSLASLTAYRASQSFADNWIVAFPVAAVICALCVATIPFWDHLGMGGGIYHVFRLAAIGLILGCIPRASILSFAFLLMLIGISNSVIDARQLDAGWYVLTDSHLYRGLLIDAASMAVALAALRVVMSIRHNPRST